MRKLQSALQDITQKHSEAARSAEHERTARRQEQRRSTDLSESHKALSGRLAYVKSERAERERECVCVCCMWWGGEGRKDGDGSVWKCMCVVLLRIPFLM